LILLNAIANYLVSEFQSAGERNAIAKAWIVTEVITLLNERKKQSFQCILTGTRNTFPTG
jgi:hypothetical protein